MTPPDTAPPGSDADDAATAAAATQDAPAAAHADAGAPAALPAPLPLPVVPLRMQDLTLVFQGPFKPYVTREREDFARNIRLTRAVLPGARIVLSTWDGVELPPGLELDAVVGSPDPGGLAPLKLGERKTNNVNRQLATTRAGLDAVETPYAAKLRTDCFLEHAGFLDHYAEQRALDGGRERLLACSFFTLDPTMFERLSYHLSDWFQFGPTALLREYWSAPFMKARDARHYERQRHASGSTLFEQSFRARYAVEQHICMHFAALRGYARPRFLNDVAPALQAEYRRFLAHEVMLLDPWQIGLRFDKYGWVGASWFQRHNNLMHLDWLALADPQLTGREHADGLRALIRQRQRSKDRARLAFRYSRSVHALLFDPRLTLHPVRRLAARLAHRLIRG